MNALQWGSLLFAALFGSVSVLIAMYLVLPGVGLPKLDFTAVTGGWVGVTGRYARLVGVAVFLAGGIGWTLLYALLWPWHNLVGGLAFSLIPFGIASLTVLPELNRLHAMLYPAPGFLWVRMGGKPSLTANLVQHLIFGLCLGQFYK